MQKNVSNGTDFRSLSRQDIRKCLLSCVVQQSHFPNRYPRLALLYCLSLLRFPRSSNHHFMISRNTASKLSTTSHCIIVRNDRAMLSLSRPAIPRLAAHTMAPAVSSVMLRRSLTSTSHLPVQATQHRALRRHFQPSPIRVCPDAIIPRMLSKTRANQATQRSTTQPRAKRSNQQSTPPPSHATDESTLTPYLIVGSVIIALKVHRGRKLERLRESQEEQALQFEAVLAELEERALEAECKSYRK